MYAPTTDSARGDTSGRGSANSILCRFVWPHGGRSVFVTGSFNRWTELLAMSPVEGCPRLFQAVHGISPGYHQFKFLVDGDWKHDEQQPTVVTNDYGTVNTFPPEASFNGALNFEMPPAMNMDLDNEAFIRVVRVEDGLNVSEIDMQNYRERISLFMSTHTAYELLPNSGKVVALDVNLPVKQAFHILYEQGIPLAPLWDSTKSQFVGMLSSLDFILILKELGNHGSNLTEEELDTHTIYAWKEGKAYVNGRVDEHGRPFTRPIISAGPYDNLKEVACRILRNRISTVPIIHSSLEDGSFPQLLNLASLSAILRCICRYFKHCAATLPILQLPICALPVVTWVPPIGERPLALSRASASLSSALDLFVQADVSCIPIVDENDSLIDVYCRSDITALAKDNIYTHINLNETTILQALQLGQDAFSSGEYRSQRCQMCLRSDTLYKAMERLSNPGVRRLIVVEAGSKRVEGIVTLSDVFKFFIN